MNMDMQISQISASHSLPLSFLPPSLPFFFLFARFWTRDLTHANCMLYPCARPQLPFCATHRQSPTDDGLIHDFWLYNAAMLPNTCCFLFLCFVCFICFYSTVLVGVRFSLWFLVNSLRFSSLFSFPPSSFLCPGDNHWTLLFLLFDN